MRHALNHEANDDIQSVEDVSNITNRDAESSGSDLESFDEWKRLPGGDRRPQNIRDALHDYLEELEEKRDETRIMALEKVCPRKIYLANIYICCCFASLAQYTIVDVGGLPRSWSHKISFGYRRFTVPEKTYARISRIVLALLVIDLDHSWCRRRCVLQRYAHCVFSFCSRTWTYSDKWHNF